MFRLIQILFGDSRADHHDAAVVTFISLAAVTFILYAPFANPRSRISTGDFIAVNLLVMILFCYTNCVFSLVIDQHPNCSCLSKNRDCSSIGCVIRETTIAFVKCPFAMLKVTLDELFWLLMIILKEALSFLWYLSMYAVPVITIFLSVKFLYFYFRKRSELLINSSWFVLARTDLIRRACEEKLKERLNCVVCTEKERDCRFDCCTHICSCMGCANKLTACPLCRAAITMRSKCHV